MAHHIKLKPCWKFKFSINVLVISKENLRIIFGSFLWDNIKRLCLKDKYGRKRERATPAAAGAPPLPPSLWLPSRPCAHMRNVRVRRLNSLHEVDVELLGLVQLATHDHLVARQLCEGTWCVEGQGMRMGQGCVQRQGWTWPSRCPPAVVHQGGRHTRDR